MFAHYLEKGHSLKDLCELSPLEKAFYIASMSVMRKEQAEEDVTLAKISNPFFAIKK